MLKILLIEDEYIIAKDLQALLGINNFAHVDTAKNYKTAYQFFTANSYDLIISDINLNEDKDGIEIISEFSKIKKTPVVYLTAYSDFEVVNRAETTMPFAYILKPYNNNQLKATINLAILNSKKASEKVVENINNTKKQDLLTRREKEVLVTLSTGKMSKEIAEVLNISPSTVEQHKKNIKKKLELSTVGELVHFAMSSKLLELSD